MTGGKRRWPLEVAQGIADRLAARLQPCCWRIQVAGSTRRRRPTVGDIELLCIPRVEKYRNLLGEETGTLDLLDCELQGWLLAGYLDYRRNRNGQRIGYGPLNKYLTHVPTGMPVDVFCTTGENWGMALLVRTGPAAFNVKVMSRLRVLGMRGHAYGGITDADGKEVSCPDEETVFRHLGWPYLQPEERS